MSSKLASSYEPSVFISLLSELEEFYNAQQRTINRHAIEVAALRLGITVEEYCKLYPEDLL